MDDKLNLAQQTIEQQISKIDAILDKREASGQQFDIFLSEEKTRLYGMLQIFWVLGGKGFDQFRN